MCFSAQFSFLAAGVLTVISYLTLRSVRRSVELPCALIPPLFAFQQAAEGVLWLALPSGTYPYLASFAAYAFLTIAFMAWPIVIPLALMGIEGVPWRRGLMALCMLFGITWSLGVLWYFVHFPIQTSIHSCHIMYQLPGFTGNTLHALYAYCVATLAPFLLASRWSVRLLGIALALSCTVSYIVWYYYFTSVWCFFAALLSVGVYHILRNP